MRRGLRDAEARIGRKRGSGGRRARRRGRRRAVAQEEQSESMEDAMARVYGPGATAAKEAAAAERSIHEARKESGHEPRS
ncbi:hypothetical protein GUJ93_ZPchr0006g43779 [Zizania palustris]|uniref:Uncharacterized protein n=1 Tax=Zizania palustris TaxID=103762 RepID=A0A8J5VLR9_ZIZPA|nr:hypothetical protein GUJ93_ZPchr0006g43779 [Zizania palustris]